MPLVAGLMLSRSYSRTERADAQSQKLVFYVAGGRFYKLNRSVRPGEGVCIRRETFEGKVCYGIHSEDGQRIGYVPREMLRILESRRIVEAHVVSTRKFGVPWHRYRVCLTTLVTL
jgi:hypothetical protein